jgi:membrane protein DedA with SNARE-associated domain
MDFSQPLIDLVARNENALGLSILGLCAFIEYVFPPFPGDLVTVFGAFLVARHGWTGPGVMGAILVGSSGGCMVAFSAGRWLARSEARWHAAWLLRLRPRIDRIVERFRRHGALYIVINRFLPSVRALFFVAAGMAGLPWWRVLGFGLVSALLWNLVLFAVGATVGREWERLVGLVHTWASLVWAGIAIVALLLIARWIVRRRSANAR